MKPNKAIKNDYFQLCGWLLFICSALFFIISSIRAGDILSLAGGILFLIACFVFLVPVISAIQSRGNLGNELEASNTETTNHN
jgi:hypothetical protein